MIPMTTEKKKLCLSLLGIFFVIFILNSLMARSAGDDYVYSFMWEGHSMYEPLSADARRFPIFMRRTTPVEPIEPAEPAEPLVESAQTTNNQ